MEIMAQFYNDPAKEFKGRKFLPVLKPERNLTERTAYMLYAYQKFVSVSNNALVINKKDGRISDAPTWGSLEGVHNAVHMLTGGLSKGGHMAQIPVSSFDPIFWLRGCFFLLLFIECAN